MPSPLVKKLALKKVMDLKTMSAASGLVKRDQKIYVIADDHLSLGIFSLDQKEQPKFLPLIAGTLPEDAKERKKLKPDWEVLVDLGKGLLAVPSGSKPNRQMGSFIPFNENGFSKIQAIDFATIYKELHLIFKDELNIEGAVLTENYFKLFQRGNGPSGKNAIIDLDKISILESIFNKRPLDPHCIQNMTPYDLKTLRDAPLGFTDACYFSDKCIYFLAVAEDTLSTYEDGPFKGAVLGKIDPEGKMEILFELDCTFKPEGLFVEDNKVYIVTDADDAKIISSLYVAQLISFKESLC